MTIQEITALRKSGNLAEALKHAEALYAQEANRYSGSTLFWCLNDLYKTQQGPEADGTYARLKDIYDAYGHDDEYMTTTIRAIEKFRNPHARELREAAQQAKSGTDPSAAYSSFNRFSQHYAAGELDQSLYRDFGWLIYYTLRLTPSNDAYRRKTMLAQYLKLNLERPSALHSLILSEAVKLEQNTPLQFRIRDFIRLWGIENLREDDWAPYSMDDGKVIPSQVEKLIGVYVKELKTDRVTPAPEMIEVIDKALVKYPASQNMPYFKATMLISLGQIDEALKYYRNLILRFPSKYYLWHQAAELVADQDTKIGLLCKALATGSEEAFLGGVRLSLAKALVDKGLLSQAKTELDKYLQTYRSRGWNLKQEFRDLYNCVQTETASADNTALYSQYGAFADSFIYSDMPSSYVIKTKSQKLEDRNHPGRFFILWTLTAPTQTYRLKRPAKHGLDPRSADGTIFEIKTLDGKIVWIKPAATVPALDWLKTVSGTVNKRTDRNGREYAIISDVYVAADLLKNVSEGARITVLALRKPDGRWAALRLA